MLFYSSDKPWALYATLKEPSMFVFILILLAIFLFVAWTLVCYLVIVIIKKLLEKLVRQRFSINKIFTYTFSLLIAGLSTCFLIFNNPEKNYKTAYIEKLQSEFKVTVKGKRGYMTHDPISALFRSTFEDSISFIIPRQNGIIQYNEIKLFPNKYKPTGTISIDNEKLTIQLYYDYAQKYSDSWNGIYNLVYRQ